MTTERNDHLSAEGIQAFLEGELPKSEVGAFRGHLSSCARCRAEVEAFQLLFAELGELPELAPSTHFADRVMEKLPSRLSRPLLQEQDVAETAEGRAGLGDWLRAVVPRRSPAPAHPSSEWLQDFVEGVLPARRHAGVAAHVSACDACGTEVDEWQSLFGKIEALPDFAPAEDFGERVMAKVRIPEAPAPVPAHALRDQALELLDRVRPRTRKGWALAGTIALAPGAAFTAVGLFILTHPLLTFGYLAAFLWWQVSGAVTALASGAMNWALESVVAFRAVEAIQSIMSSPALAVLSLATLAVLMWAALRIFYQNLILSPTVAGHDAR